MAQSWCYSQRNSLPRLRQKKHLRRIMVLNRLEPGREFSKRKQVAKLRKAFNGKSTPLRKMNEYPQTNIFRVSIFSYQSNLYPQIQPNTIKTPKKPHKGDRLSWLYSLLSLWCLYSQWLECLWCGWDQRERRTVPLLPVQHLRLHTVLWAGLSAYVCSSGPLRWR